ncbi:MAG: pyridoxamine 5'-phosphate oxidase family protein [Proteobacteria bacterium]|nr:pyridoxamine 5'-phosphate oxidase family protein [Pseudomonadota bacterium]
MAALNKTAPAFVEMAHRIVWCSVATVDSSGRPRSRVLHPIWQWDGNRLTGWIATGPTPTKRAHLKASPNVSCNYWAPTQDTCVAECRASFAFDSPTRKMVWDLFANGPAPVGYDPAIIPGWDGPDSEGFAAPKLDPWRLRVMPGSVMMAGAGETLVWQE